MMIFYIENVIKNSFMFYIHCSNFIFIVSILFIYLFIYLFMYLSIYLFHLFICLSGFKLTWAKGSSELLS